VAKFTAMKAGHLAHSQVSHWKNSGTVPEFFGPSGISVGDGTIAGERNPQ
jgi:hypothetical protein